MTTESDPLLLEINPPTLPEKERLKEHPICHITGRHRYGFTYEDMRSKQVVSKRVCVRGRGGWFRGRCPAWKSVTVPSSGSDVEEQSVPSVVLPAREWVRLATHDWGVPLSGPYPPQREVLG